MMSSERPILEYRGAADPHEPPLGNEAQDAREVFGWPFVSLVAVPLVFGLVLAIGNVFR